MVNIVFQCAICQKELSSHQQEEFYAQVNFDFKAGVVSYECPYCQNLNYMKFIANDRMVELNKLPGIRGFNG